jgi:hypothetical protein
LNGELASHWPSYYKFKKIWSGCWQCLERGVSVTSKRRHFCVLHREQPRKRPRTVCKKVKQSRYTPRMPWGERRYSPYSFTTSALDRVSGQHHAPGSYTTTYRLKTSSSGEERVVSAPALCSVGVVIMFYTESHWNH